MVWRTHMINEQDPEFETQDKEAKPPEASAETEEVLSLNIDGILNLIDRALLAKPDQESVLSAMKQKVQDSKALIDNEGTTSEQTKKARAEITTVEKTLKKFMEENDIELEDATDDALASVKQKTSNAMEQDRLYGVLDHFILIANMMIRKTDQFLTNYAADKDIVVKEQKVYKRERVDQLKAELERLLRAGLKIRDARPDKSYDEVARDLGDNVPQLINIAKLDSLSKFLKYFEQLGNQLAKIVNAADEVELQADEDIIKLTDKEIIAVGGIQDTVSKIEDETLRTALEDPKYAEAIENLFGDEPPPQNEQQGEKSILDELGLYYQFITMIDKRSEAGVLKRSDIAKIKKLDFKKINVQNVDSMSSLTSVFRRALSAAEKEQKTSPQYIVDKLISDTEQALKRTAALLKIQPEQIDDEEDVQDFLANMPMLESSKSLKARKPSIQKVFSDIKENVDAMLAKLEELSKQEYRTPEEKIKAFFEKLYGAKPKAIDLAGIVKAWKRRFNKSMLKDKLRRALSGKTEPELQKSLNLVIDYHKRFADSASQQDAIEKLRKKVSIGTIKSQEELLAAIKAIKNKQNENIARSLVKTIKEHIRKRNG